MEPRPKRRSSLTLFRPTDILPTSMVRWTRTLRKACWRACHWNWNSESFHVTGNANTEHGGYKAPYTLPVFTGHDHGRDFGHPCSRSKNTCWSPVYRSNRIHGPWTRV